MCQEESVFDVRQTVRSNYRSALAYDESSWHNFTVQNYLESRNRNEFVE